MNTKKFGQVGNLFHAKKAKSTTTKLSGKKEAEVLTALKKFLDDPHMKLTYGYQNMFKVVTEQTPIIQHEYREALLHRLGSGFTIIKVPIIKTGRSKVGKVERVDGILESDLSRAINSINAHLGIDEWNIDGSLQSAMDEKPKTEETEAKVPFTEEQMAAFMKFMEMENRNKDAE